MFMGDWEGVLGGNTVVGIGIHSPLLPLKHQHKACLYVLCSGLDKCGPTSATGPFRRRRSLAVTR